MRRLLLTLVFASFAWLAGCGGGGSSTSPGSGSGGGQVSLQSITVNPATSSIAPGTIQAFTAMGMYSDGSSKDVTLAVQWASAAPNVATVSSSAPTQGMATAVAGGTALVNAAMDGVTGSATLTVKSGLMVNAVVVTPATPTIGLGGQQQFTATAMFSDGSQQDVTNASCWSLVSNFTGLSVPFIAGTNGLAIGESQSVGCNSVTASFPNSGGCSPNANFSGSDTEMLTVDPFPPSPAPSLTSVAILPANPTIASHTQLQLSAIGTFSDGSTRDVTGLVSNSVVGNNWSSSNTGAATFGFTSGSLLSAKSAGSSTITATVISPNTGNAIVSAPTTVNVTAQTLTSLVVYPINPPANNTIAPGTKLNYAAVGIFQDPSTGVISTQDLSNQVQWSVSNFSIASVPLGEGVVTALSTGLGTMQSTMVLAFGPASLGFLEGMTTLNVDDGAAFQSIAVTPATAFVAPGASLPYTATGTFMNAATQTTTMLDLSNAAVWSSKSKSVATTAANVVTGQGAGQTAIAAKYTPSNGTTGPVSGTANLMVALPQQISLAITPSAVQIASQTSTQLKAIGTFVDGTTQDFSSSVEWSTSTPVGTTVVGPTGIVSGLAAGTSTISASLGSLTSSAQVTVTNATLKSIAISPANPSVAAGAMQQLAAMGTFSDNSTQDLTASVTWSASVAQTASPSVAMVNQTGLVTGLVAGTSPVTITATLNGTSGSTNLTVQ